MTKVVDVRYRGSGKSYRFLAGDLPIRSGDHVIVENSKGKAFAYAQNVPYEMFGEPVKPLKSVLRLANEEDEERNNQNIEREKEAKAVCRQLIEEEGLEMKLVSVEQAFVGKKMTFYFTADERVDFRELVKELAARFHSRIEMRQIGVRDETTMCGGVGVCGRELCCCTFLRDFAPVSIKMAKAQNLSLNPGKISGVCGRLMCCLRNEAATYEELNKTIPRKGEKVKTPEGEIGTVISLDVIRQRAKVLIQVDEDNKEIKDYSAEELEFKRRGGPRQEDGAEEKKMKDGPVKSEKKAEGGEKKDGEKKDGEKKHRRRRRNRNRKPDGKKGGAKSENKGGEV